MKDKSGEVSRLYHMMNGSSRLGKLAFRAQTLVTERVRTLSRTLLEPSAPKLTSDGTKVVTVGRLESQHLSDLTGHAIAAIHVKGFTAADLADQLADWLVERTTNRWRLKRGDLGFERGDTDFLVGVGMPLSDALLSEDAFESYLDDAVPAIRRLRDSTTQLIPTDRLRLELDELWPHGARIGCLGTRKFLSTVARVQNPETVLHEEGIIHVDTSLPRLTPDGMLTVNSYLRVPPSGGELLLWNVAPSAWDLLRGLDAYTYLREYRASAEEQQRIRSRLPEPLRIKPEQGDLILFNPARPHSVRSFSEGTRVSLQAFIRFARNQPLEFSI